jgi:hypothetical protein
MLLDDLLNRIITKKPDKPFVNDWIETTATVISCEMSYNDYPYTNPGFQGPQIPHYTITFSYEVNGRTFKGRFNTGAPDEIGHKLKISYDPMHPGNNSGSDPTHWRVAIAVAIFFVALKYWFDHR